MPTYRLPANDLEYAVLQELWRMGTATVRELHKRVSEERVYTTTARTLDRLLDKGLIRRQLEGHAYIYRPRVPPREIEHARIRHIVNRLLGPRPQGIIAALVQAVDEVDPQLLDNLEQEIRTRQKHKHAG